MVITLMMVDKRRGSHWVGKTPKRFQVKWCEPHSNGPRDDSLEDLDLRRQVICSRNGFRELYT